MVFMKSRYDLTHASMDQLYQIATNEPVGLSFKYAAAREMQRRDGRFKDWMYDVLFRLYPRYETSEIAKKLNVNYRILNLKCSQIGLKRGAAR